MRTGDSTRSSFTNGPPLRRPAMEDDDMDAGIDMSEETGNQSSPPLALSSTQNTKPVRSHPKLTRAASKPESGSRQGMARLSVCVVLARKALIALYLAFS
jgi:hypothetical protein